LANFPSLSSKQGYQMAKTDTQMSLADVRKKYDSIDCFFTYYDGDKSTFDFYGTDATGYEVRISLGGCPAWIKNISFGPNDPLNISDALERHVRYISVTDNRSKIVYEQIFDTN
jgi:hypothetical protein